MQSFYKRQRQVSVDVTPLLAVALVACGGGGGGSSTPERINQGTVSASNNFDANGFRDTITAEVIPGTTTITSALQYQWFADGVAIPTPAGTAQTLMIPQSAYGRPIDVAISFNDNISDELITIRNPAPYYNYERLVTGRASGSFTEEVNDLPADVQNLQGVGQLYGDAHDVYIIIVDYVGVRQEPNAPPTHPELVWDEAQAHLPVNGGGDINLIRVQADEFASDGSYLPASSPLRMNAEAIPSIDTIMANLDSHPHDDAIIFIFSVNVVPEDLLDFIPANSIVIYAAGNSGDDPLNPTGDPAFHSPNVFIDSNNGPHIQTWDLDRVAFVVGSAGTTGNARYELHPFSTPAGDAADYSFIEPYQSAAGTTDSGTSFAAPTFAAKIAILYEVLHPRYGVTLPQTLEFAKAIADRNSEAAAEVGNGRLDLNDILHTYPVGHPRAGEIVNGRPGLGNDAVDFNYNLPTFVDVMEVERVLTSIGIDPDMV